MSVFPYTVAALVIAGVASTASLATSQDGPEPAELSCALHLSQTGQTVTLTAEAHAPLAIQGTYTLVVHQSGSGGRVTIQQGGTFDLRPNQRIRLGEAQLSANRRALSAELTLIAGDQRRTCTDFSL
ncbi:MAG: hypothetical protein JXQ79_10160 [Rhodobacteraceae bacterium]|nr:hypothetical protein [Paracoccaceae bacterium]